MRITECPHCRQMVVPMADSVCPACRGIVFEGSKLRWGDSGETTHAVGERPLARPGFGQNVLEFHRALLACTPRLLATPAIVAVNVLVFVLMVATGVHFFSPTVDHVAAWGANFGPLTMNGQWWRLLTSMFLHYGILHLGFNMWVLWNLGQLVERLVGNVGFLLLYLVSGIAGSLASLAWNPLAVSAGASGAVFGVAGALLGLIAFRRDTVPLRVLEQLRGSMLAFLGYNVLIGITIPGIDMAAHAGGFVAGVACGLVLSQPLSTETMPRRWSRNGLLLVAGVIALPLAAFALPDAPADIQREMERFIAAEKQALNAYSDLVQQSQRGEITDEEFAAMIQRDILPSWIEARQRIEGLLDAPHANTRYITHLVEYMKCRELSWRLQVQGTNEQDMAKLAQAAAEWAKAEEIAQQLSDK